MPVHSWRGSVAATAVAAFLALTLTSTPSISSISAAVATPSERPPLFSVAGPQSRPLSFGAVTRAEAQSSLGLVSFQADPDPRAVRLQQRFVAGLPHGREIEFAAQKSGLDSLLIASVAEAESGFEPTVVSVRGAVGLMQILPETAAIYGVEKLEDPSANLKAGSLYLATLLNQFDGNLEYALAAYNAGPGVVERFGGVPPYRETRAYVRRVLDLYRGHQDRIFQAAVESSGASTSL